MKPSNTSRSYTVPGSGGRRRWSLSRSANQALNPVVGTDLSLLDLDGRANGAETDVGPHDLAIEALLALEPERPAEKEEELVLTHWRTATPHLKGRRNPADSRLEQHQGCPPSPEGRWSRARACWHSAVITVNIIVRSLLALMIKTYIIPDRHDEDHGDGECLVELAPAADLGEAVAVTKDLKLIVAELRRDVARVGNSVVCGRRNLMLLAVLDEELGQLLRSGLRHNPFIRLDQQLSNVL